MSKLRRIQNPEVMLIEELQYVHVPDIMAMYNFSVDIIGYRFDFYDDTGLLVKMKEFRDVPSCRRVAEEMIHLCLPAPDDSMNTPRGDDDVGLWKRCFFDLLNNTL